MTKIVIETIEIRTKFDLITVMDIRNPMVQDSLTVAHLVMAMAVLEYRSDNLFDLNLVHLALAMNMMNPDHSMDNSEAQLA